MKRTHHPGGAFITALALGSSLLLASGCATGRADTEGEELIANPFSKKEGIYQDPSYEGTNRRQSQTSATPFR